MLMAYVKSKFNFIVNFNTYLKMSENCIILFDFCLTKAFYKKFVCKVLLGIFIT